MLGSITALGERGRGSRWTTTVVAYVIGSAVGGLAVGATLGLVGAALAPPPAVGLLVMATLIGAGVVLDLGPRGLALPTIRRQVNEAWLHRYRPWVYGTGFGFQLGAGVVTVVVGSAVYAAFAASFLTGSLVRGAAIGAAFGAARAATIVPAGRIRRPAQLGLVDARLRAWDGPSRRIAVGCEVALIAACVSVALA
jgi:hypothetical protein